MPTSSGVNKEYVKEVLASLGKIEKVLDIGCGKGNLHHRYHGRGQIWTGVEIWEPYVERYLLHEKYAEIIVGDARTLEFGEDKYDVAFAGDVLEHMTAQEAAEVLAKLRRAAKTVIMQVPIGHYPQGPWEGNPYETHVVDNWNVPDVLSCLGHTDEYRITHPIGTFIYRRPKRKTPIKIAVYAISKNEAAFVDAFTQSAADADYIIIGDTGSTDNTAALARAAGATVYDISIRPWRFDLARNAVLSLVPADVDVCISLDLDEKLAPGWRAEIERLWTPDVTTRLRYKFDWGQGITFHYEKIHHKSGYHWHHPCHEYPRADPRTRENLAISDMVLVTHHPDPTKSRGQYMDLLEVAVTEDPACPRNAFYYARELTFNSRWDEAIVALDRYMKLPAHLWDNEVSYAMRLMGQAHGKLGRPDEEMKWLRKACAETPNSREPWFALAAACNVRNDWAEMFGATSRALAITRRELVYTCDPTTWGYQMHDYHALAAHHLGLHELAIEHGEIALGMAPDDTRLQSNLTFYKKSADEAAPGWLQDRAAMGE